MVLVVLQMPNAVQNPQDLSHLLFFECWHVIHKLIASGCKMAAIAPGLTYTFKAPKRGKAGKVKCVHFTPIYAEIKSCPGGSHLSRFPH